MYRRKIFIMDIWVQYNELVCLFGSSLFSKLGVYVFYSSLAQATLSYVTCWIFNLQSSKDILATVIILICSSPYNSDHSFIWLAMETRMVAYMAEIDRQMNISSKNHILPEESSFQMANSLTFNSVLQCLD